MTLPHLNMIAFQVGYFSYDLEGSTFIVFVFNTDKKFTFVKDVLEPKIVDSHKSSAIGRILYVAIVFGSFKQLAQFKRSWIRQYHKSLQSKTDLDEQNLIRLDGELCIGSFSNCKEAYGVFDISIQIVAKG